MLIHVFFVTLRNIVVKKTLGNPFAQAFGIVHSQVFPMTVKGSGIRRINTQVYHLQQEQPAKQGL